MQSPQAIRPGRYNVLYIDDEENNIIVFRNAFFRYYNIFTALSGEQGLEVLRKEDIHLVITDQKMPGMTGVEVLEQVVKEFPNTMRMILTAYSDIEVIMKAINECGIYQYLLKPWEAREVKIVIDNALENHRLTEHNRALVQNLKEANEGLEVKVKERTEELERINAIKDKLFSIISHDLRTPMASFKVFLDVLMSFRSGDIDQEKLDAYYLKMHGYIHSVMNLLDNLLNWSLTQLGEKQAVLAEVDLVKQVQETIELSAPAASKKKLTIKESYGEEPALVLGDQNMISLILRNLIGNAIKFSHEGSQIEVSLRREGDKISVAVADEGVGMSEEVLQDLFDPAIHISSRGTGEEKGAGLGLKLCKEFVEMQTGDLSVRSEHKKGTTFICSLPVAAR